MFEELYHPLALISFSIYIVYCDQTTVNELFFLFLSLTEEGAVVGRISPAAPARRSKWSCRRRQQMHPTAAAANALENTAAASTEFNFNMVQDAILTVPTSAYSWTYIQYSVDSKYSI